MPFSGRAALYLPERERWRRLSHSSSMGKLIRTLESLANDPRLNAQANMEKAIIEWREDMDWVKQNLRVAAP